MMDIYTPLTRTTQQAPFTPSYVIQSLSISSDPAALYASRVKNRHMLFENPARKPKTPKSRPDRRRLPFPKIEHIKYAQLIPLHLLWLDYMSELQPSAPKLLKADLHGCILTVLAAKNPCLVAISGIVIHESENAFRLVTKDDRVKLIPKQNTIFTLAVPAPSFPQSSPSTTVLESPHLLFTLYGNQFRFRSADRAGRKFKAKESIEL